VGLNLVIGFLIPFIDNLGHMGGLIGGAVMALVLSNRVIPSEPNHLEARVAMGAASGGLLILTLLGLIFSWIQMSSGGR
jgi:membrane associated rhomboid family serine protease